MTLSDLAKYYDTKRWIYLLQVDFIKNCGNDSECDSNLLVRGILQLDRLDSIKFVVHLVLILFAKSFKLLK